MTKLSPSYCFTAFSFMLLLSACGGSSSSSSNGNNEVEQPAGQTQENSNPQTDNSDTDSTVNCEMTKDQQEMLNLVNQARGRGHICGSDSMPVVAALSWSCQLRNSAQGHSKDMAEVNFFSHTGSSGLTVGDRVTASDYSWSRVGENIAAGQTTTTQVMTGWLNSPGHCRNIMSAGFTEFGSAVVTNPHSDYSNYWTQVFARPR